jgi:hypothetical protein
MPDYALHDREIRSVRDTVELLMSRDNRGLAVPRMASKRVFCVCCGFARLATAIFRAHAVPARCRVGFAAYFTPGFFEDHWVSEYWDGTQWHLLDAELDEAAVAHHGISFAPSDVPRNQFINGATAWCGVRSGEFVCAVAFVGALQMRPAALVQLGCIGLHPAPDAAGIHLNAAFRQEFRDMFVG